MSKKVRVRYSRRGFTGLAGAAVAGLVGDPWPSAAEAAEGQDADLVVFNAKVYTVDSRAPKAEAFAVKGGRFAAVGSSAEIKAFIGKGTQTFDAKQMTIVPGFIDCHNHAPGNVLLYEVLVGNPYVVEFVTIAQHHRKAARQSRPDAAGHLGGRLFLRRHQGERQSPDQRSRPRPGVARTIPVVVHHRGGHTSFYNSKALEMAGINKNTPNPPGGTFDRDANGELNGRVTDRARSRASIRSASAPSFTEEQKLQRDRDGLAYISKQFVRYGVTSVHHEGGDLVALQQVRARGDLLHRGELRGQRQGAGFDDRRRHRERLRRRVDPAGRHFRAHRRRVVLRAHHGAQHALSRRHAAVQRQPHRDAGRPQRLDRARASGRHPGELPRQWGRGHRYGADRGGARAASSFRAPMRAPRSPTAR